MKVMVDSRLRDHPKLLRLAGALGVKVVTALGHLVHFLCWVMDLREPGNLSGLTEKEIARAGEWKGNPRKFVSALKKTGWLDETEQGFQVHDWEEHQGPLIRQRIRDRERKKKTRTQDSTGTSSGTSGGTSTGSHPCHSLSISLPSPSRANPGRDLLGEARERFRKDGAQ